MSEPKTEAASALTPEQVEQVRKEIADALQSSGREARGDEPRSRRSRLGPVVKVQLSLHTTAGLQRALIYNRDRSLIVEIVADAELVERMGDRNKAFFRAGLDPHGALVLGEEVEDPGW